ncbi:TRAP transporter substrate-binding protein [Oceanimonas sp. CHS3-5]|uniref:TRAP transporter substrate-binding protein n=1 Tax=Oceanimonas sp. CHS3-5 TaxID=3068186 RepID=UPI00273DD090|nr:TRAP transporter substrate-binding protein [Oceanimonas sp. CHS3-5]MDP5290985.1 TRAP transporter substrate-binding protein [Oceanimonas sp. CHS3-5]
MMRKLIVSTLLGSVLASTPALAETINLKVIGQPLATGLIQKNKEQPFFENLAEKTGLPLKVNYKPLDTTGIKDVEQLRVLKSGLFDLISLRMSQISRDEPTILGLDLVGLNPDFEQGRKVVAAYKDTVDQRLQERFNTKLLGVWPFGPQVLFCNHPINGLEDVKGLKVRVYDQNLAQFVESVGGVPVPVAFGDVHQSLALGMIECAITGPSSANSAGWPEVTTHMLPLGFQLALNGYGINLKAWNKLDEAQQQTLQAAFDELNEEIWSYSEELFLDASRCNVGEQPCETGKSFNLVEVPVNEADLATVASTVTQVSYPTWAEQCDKSNPDCSANWKRDLKDIVGL